MEALDRGEGDDDNNDNDDDATYRLKGGCGGENYRIFKKDYSVSQAAK